MNTKIIQKHVIKGSREFELVGDEINYKIKSPLGQEELTVVLSVLNPEPVVSGSTLSFLSKVNGEALIELFVDKPDKKTFDAFVSAVQQQINQDDFGLLRPNKNHITINQELLDTTITMLNTYIDPNEIEPLLTALNALKSEPDSMQCLNDLADAFNGLGFVQTSVLTYAPYINSILSGVNEDESHADHYR